MEDQEDELGHEDGHTDEPRDPQRSLQHRAARPAVTAGRAWLRRAGHRRWAGRATWPLREIVTGDPFPLRSLDRADTTAIAADRVRRHNARLDPLEVPGQLPVASRGGCDATHSCSAVLSRWWCTSGPKASSGHGGVAQLGDRLDQGRGDARHVGRLVGVARVGVAGLELVVDAVEARRDGAPPARDTGSRPPRDPRLHPPSRPVPDDAEAAGAVVLAPDRRRSGPSCPARSAGTS